MRQADYQMGFDLDLSNLSWDDILKAAGGEATAQILQQPEVQDLVKSAGGDIAVKTAAQKTEEFKVAAAAYLDKIAKYKFWLIGGAVVLGGLWFMKKQRKLA